MSRPSVRTIATRLGVSAATVSRVLNGRPGVSEELRAKVLRGMREHGLIAPAAEPFVGIIVPSWTIRSSRCWRAPSRPSSAATASPR